MELPSNNPYQSNQCFGRRNFLMDGNGINWVLVPNLKRETNSHLQ
jgi:hypothetical protein